MKKLFVFGCVVCLALVFSVSAFARDARLDALVNEGLVTEEDIAAAEIEGPNNWMAKTAYDVYVGGFIQPRFKYVDDGDPQSAFDVRRARLIIKGKLGDDWGFILNPEFAGDPQIILAGVTVNVGDGTLKFGQFLTPLVLESYTSSAKLDTIDRATITAQAAPWGDIGAFLVYPLMEGKVDIQAAVVNGTGPNTAENNDEKDYYLRVNAKPFQGSEGPADGLMIGAAYRMGEQQELDAEGVDLGDFELTCWVGTVQWFYEQFKVQGEYINLEQDLAAGGSTETDGWYVLASYDLPVDSMVVTPVVKWEDYGPDAAANCTCGGNWITLGVRLSFVGTHDVKLEANYVIEDLDEGEDIDEFILQLTAIF